MSLYIPEGTPPVIPAAMARIERRLLQPGHVRVRVGSRVEPDDVVAHTYLSAAPKIINVARLLVIPPSQLARAMRREVGNKVAQGDVLARVGRLGGRSCQAPISGIIAAVDTETGYVTIAPEPTEYELTASIRGIVMDVLPHEGVVIETPAAQVYGAFGLGEENSGVLRLLVTDPHEMITAEAIDPRSAYAILIGGAGVTAAALRRAVQEKVRGVIVGGIEEHELRTFLGWNTLNHWQVGFGSWQMPHAQHVPNPGLTIVITEGFGLRPMAQPLFDLLSEQDRHEALIEGLTQLRRPLRRPRVVIPLARSTGVQVEPTRPQLRPGAMVRLLDNAHLGQVARVRAVSTFPRRIGAGAYAAAVEVVQENMPPFWVPRTSVETFE
jgi:hypothetical protein